MSPRPEPIGLVHDYLLVMRGAERTFAAIADCFRGAPIHTTLFSNEGTDRRFAGREIRTSILQHTRVRQRGFRRLLPLYPAAVERLDVKRHDLIVSSSSAFAHGVRPRPDATHVCYCHSPFRYAWHERSLALEEAPRPLRAILARTLEAARRWDLGASQRVTTYVAGSRLVQQRIADFYGRESIVLNPPVETHRFTPGVAEDYFLVVCQLVRHKRVDAALEAARRSGVPIKVVGSGPDLERLRAHYGDSADFVVKPPDEEVADLYARARALIVPNVEEFGIAAVEAQAAGRPVVAVDAGGTRETVVNGATGVLMPTGTVDEIAEAIRETDFDRFDPCRISAHAESFSVERFQHQLRGIIAHATGQIPVPHQPAVSS